VALLPLGATDLARGDAVLYAWEDAFLPLRGVWLRDAHGLDPAPVDVTLEGEGLVLSAVKPARVGAGLVLRCYNASDRRVGGAWRFGDGIRTAHRVRADERESQELVLEQRGKTVRFIAEPHEIVTMLIT
jgi:alpha-mannosidase